MTIWEHLDRRAVAAAANADPPPLYGRVCERCGHLELSENELLFTTWRECPRCSPSGSRATINAHGRVVIAHPKRSCGLRNGTAGRLEPDEQAPRG